MYSDFVKFEEEQSDSCFRLQFLIGYLCNSKVDFSIVLLSKLLLNIEYQLTTWESLIDKGGTK
jgi:hypothetical protein